MKENEIIKILLSSIGGFIASLFGGFDVMLQTLLLFMVLDYFTGIIKAVIKKQLSSNKGFKGGAKKIGILFIIMIAYRVDVTFGVDYIRNAAVIFYSTNEAISILENVALIGVKIPKKLKAILIQLNKENN